VVAAAAVYKMNLCSGYSIEANNEATQGFSSYCLEVSFIFSCSFATEVCTVGGLLFK